MLVIRRAEKAETLVNLLQSYYTQLSKHIGVLEEKQGIVMHHAKSESALFNRIVGYQEPKNVLNIAALLEHAKSHGHSFLWYSHDGNIHLHKYLLDQGLDRREPLQGFYFNAKRRMPDYKSHPAVKLLEVRTEEQFYEWCHVFSLCHGVPLEAVCEYFESGYGEERTYTLMMAQVYQKTIACSAFYVYEDNAILLWDSVLPMYRRQGVGSMMAIHRMQMAKKLKCKGVYALGMDSYAAMLKDIGFRHIGKFQTFFYSAEEKDDG